MKDRDVDTFLSHHLSGDQPREAFKEKTLRNSTDEFMRIRRRRSAWQRAERAAAAVLIAGIAFLGGRLSAPSPMPRNMDITPQATAQPGDVTVPRDLIAWLDAARLFGQLGMRDRMARAVERAGRLLPSDTSIADTRAKQAFAAGAIKNQTGCVESMGISSSKPSSESMNRILAQVFGD